MLFRSSSGYVGGHTTADEGRELRRFDNVREDRGRRGPRKGGHGGLTVSGEAAAKQSQKPLKQRKDKGARALPEGNPAAFRSWYVPDGVDTGPSGHRNADGRGPKKPRGKKSGQGRPQGKGPAKKRGSAPNFPSDHATPGGRPSGPRGPRPGGNRRPAPRGPRGGNR